jgi:hypothetical protein
VLQDEKQTNPDQLATYCIDTPQKTPAGRATAQTGDSAKLTSLNRLQALPRDPPCSRRRYISHPGGLACNSVNQPVIISILTYLKQP